MSSIPFIGYSQSAWEAILSLGYSNQFIFIVGTNVSAFLVYWVLALAFLYLDLYASDIFIEKYKVQKIKKRVSTAIVWQTVSKVLMNQIIITLPLSFLFSALFSFDRELPNIEAILFHLVISVLCIEIGFYYCHRLVHHPLLYKV
jgi:sterol desaturase/sphingolipid hydroxylase (fatty acid hydroxylase superfamily)